MGSLTDVGISDAFIQDVRDKVTPGGSALFALTSDDAETRRCAEAALGHLLPGSADWYQCAAHMLVSCGRLKEWAEVTRWLDAVLDAAPGLGALPALTLCLSRAGFMFMMQGRQAEMKRIAEEIYFHALQASTALAAERGPHEAFQETLAARGELQFDAWGIEPEDHVIMFLADRRQVDGVQRLFDSD